jgi:ATP-binding cassette subfamily C protein CydD
MMDDTAAHSQNTTRSWLKAEARLGREAARPIVLLGLAGTLLAMGQALCAAVVLTAALAGVGEGASAGLPVAALVGFGVLALLRAGFQVMAERAAFAAGATARRRLRSDIMTRLLATGPALLRRFHSAELAGVVIDKIEAMNGFYANYTPALVLAVAGPVLVCAAVLWVDPVAGLILGGCGLLVPFAMAASGIGAAAASRGQFLAMSRLQTRFLDRVRGIATIVLYNRAEAEAVALGKAADELRRRTMRVLRVAFLSSAALDLAMALALVAIALRYGYEAMSGRLPSQAVAIFVLLSVPEFFLPLRRFSAAYQDRIHATAAAEGLAGLALPEPVAIPSGPVRNVEARGLSVVFDNVSLTWDASRGRALDGLSFRVGAGETLVLAGPSGSGKSSVIEILLGFVRPDSGRVTLNGADIADLVPQALSGLTAWVGQRPMLFAGTIRENIRFARPAATDSEIAEAARQARVSDFAAELPSGLDTVVGEGGYGLSGGQAQRVAIARAFLKNAALLLLDEPTAHLDPATEQEVLESLRRLAIGRTVILASHSTAAHGFAWGSVGRRIDLRDGRAIPARGVA